MSLQSFKIKVYPLFTKLADFLFASSVSKSKSAVTSEQSSIFSVTGIVYLCIALSGDFTLSAEAYKAIFLIVDHADVKYQKRYFTPLNKLSKQGLIKPYDIATLRDRILMHSNKKQIFGTQTIAKPIVITDNSSSPQLTSYVWAVKNPAKLEARRAEVGLSSIQEQIKAHASHGYQLIYDPTLSKRDIRAITKSPNK